MKPLNLIIAFSLIGFSAFISLQSMNLGLGRIQAPGPGFMPFLVSLILFCLSVVAVILAFTGQIDHQKGRFSTDRKHLVKPGILLVSILGYSFILEALGFVIATFLVMFMMLSISHQHKWRRNIVVSSAVALVTFFVFNKWLGVQLPAGMLRL